MDEIQKILIEAGRKDLAQKYYLKIASIKKESSLKGMPKEIIERFVKNFSIGEKSKWNDAAKLKKPNKSIPVQVLFKGSKPVLYIIYEGSYGNSIKDARGNSIGYADDHKSLKSIIDLDILKSK